MSRWSSPDLASAADANTLRRFGWIAPLCLIASCSNTPGQTSGGTGTVPEEGMADSAVIVIAGREAAKSFSDAQARLTAGDYEGLLKDADEVIAASPNSGLAHEVRGAALLGLGRAADAIAAFRRATEVEQGQSGPWTKLGIVQMESGSVEAALASLRKAIEINPSDRFAHQRLGLLYEYQGDGPRAIEHLQLGLSGTPTTYLGVAVNLARLLAVNGRPQEAVDVLGSRLPMGHADATAHLVLAGALYSTGRHEQARERYERAAALDATLIEARLGIAMAYRELGDTAKALELFDQIYSERPGWTPGVIERGKTLIAAGRTAEAAAAFDHYVSVGGDEARVNQYRAQLQVKSADFAKARETYMKIVASGKAEPAVYAQLSELYLSQGDVKNAEQALRNGLKAFPDNPYLTMRLGAYLASVTRYDEAVPVLERARAQAPDNAVVLRMLTLARMRRGDSAGAVEAAARLYEVAKDSDAGLLYATRLEADRQTEAAARVYRQVIAADPGNAIALNNLASLLAQTGQLEEAEHFARQAVERLPKEGRVLDTLGWLLYRRGKHDEAVETLSSAVKLAPAAGIVRYHQGIALDALGRRSEARQAFAEALRLEAGAQWAADARARLDKLR